MTAYPIVLHTMLVAGSCTSIYQAVVKKTDANKKQ